MAKERKADAQPKESRQELCTCLWCGLEFLADPTKRPKYHQTGSCKQYAYRQRRNSAIETVATIRGYSVDKAARTVKREGMVKVQRFLKREGFVYDEQSRCWGVPVGSVTIDVEQGRR